MELCKAESFRIFHHHYRGIGHINSNFNNSGGDENLNLLTVKTFHNLILLSACHLSVKIIHFNRWRKDFLYFFCIVQNIFQIHKFTFFHHRTDNIHLMALMDLIFNKSISSRPISRINHTIFNRLSFCRKLINDGNIQISIKNNRQSPWNRRSTHNEYMGQTSFSQKPFPLIYAEAMLFIGNDHTKIMKMNLFLNDCMSTDEDVDFMGFQRFINRPFFSYLHRTGQKSDSDTYPRFLIKSLKIIQKTLIMLSGQYLRRCHQTALISGLYCRQKSQLGDNCFPGTHIALKQTIHHMGTGKICRYLLPGSELSICQTIIQASCKLFRPGQI